MRLKACGVRDTARVLQLSTSTVINALKKRAALASVHTPRLRPLAPHDVEVGLSGLDHRIGHLV